MRHALLARDLIGACGGLNEAASACRLERSRLAMFQDPNSASFMPADVIADLEAYCGRPLYSQALIEARPGGTDHANLAIEVCEAAEAAVDLQRVTRRALADGKLTYAERKQVEAALAAVLTELRQVAAAADGGGA